MKPKSPIQVVFVDRITLFSWVKTRFSARTARTVWHFDPLSPFWARWIARGRRIGLISREVRQVDCHVGHVRNKSGRSDYIALLQSITETTNTIRRDLLRNHPLLRVMEPEWPARKVVLHFEKLVEQNIRLEYLRLYLAEWMLRSRLGMSADQGILLIKHSPWHSQLKTFALTMGVPLASYRQLWDLPDLVQAFRKFLSRFSHFVRRLGYYLLNPFNRSKSSSKSPKNQPLNAPCLAIHYWYRNLSFDLTERSEFFWLKGSGISPSEIILYDYVSKQPLDEATWNDLRDRRIRVSGRAPQIPLWHATSLAWQIALRKMMSLALGTLVCLLRNRRISLHDLRCLFRLVTDYAYWYDFFKHHQVRVNVGTFNTSVGQVLALEALGGVSIGYQISISNIIFPSRILTGGEHIQFVFSPLFEELWHCIEAPSDTFVHTGFIYDKAFVELRNADCVRTTRRNLEEKGAHLILCFFDENVNNRWDIPAWDEDIRRDYEFLLRWLLEDPTLGIVFKPKYSPLLFQRLTAISRLLEEARQTGRCHFMTSDQFYGNVFPAQAALVADLCVGKLMGGTAALEAQLVGVPTFMIDLEDFHDHPLRHITTRQIIFDSWSSFRQAVEEYRRTPQRDPSFGRWTPGLDLLDPFQDGRASERMGSYVHSVYEALKAGSSKEETLAVAARQYANRWGEGHVVPGTDLDHASHAESIFSGIMIHAEQRTTD